MKVLSCLLVALALSACTGLPSAGRGVSGTDCPEAYNGCFAD